MKKKLKYIAASILFIIGIWHFKKLYQVKNKPSLNYLKVGTTADYPPFCFIQNHTIVGFEVDIIKEIAKQLEKKIDLVDIPFNVLLPGLQKGKFDIVAGGLTPDSQRTNVLFTQPYYQGDPLAIVTLKNINICKMSDLYKKTVAVNDGYTADLYMSKISGPIIKRLPSIADALLALKSKRVDAFITAMSTITPIIKHENTEFNITPIANTQEKYALVIAQEKPEFHEEICKILETMLNDGTIETLKKKWELS